MQQQTCLFCGNHVAYIHVHGHYQCPVCNANALPCCDGDNCDTNLILESFEETTTIQQPNHKQKTINDKL